MARQQLMAGPPTCGRHVSKKAFQRGILRLQRRHLSL